MVLKLDSKAFKEKPESQFSYVFMDTFTIQRNYFGIIQKKLLCWVIGQWNRQNSIYLPIKLPEMSGIGFDILFKAFNNL
jgi:hypothetical protein